MRRVTTEIQTYNKSMKTFIIDFFSLVSIVLGPFFTFLLFNDYGIIAAEIFVILGIIAFLAMVSALLLLAAGRRSPISGIARAVIFSIFLTFFLDVQFEFSNQLIIAIFLGWTGVVYVLRRHINVVVLFAGTLVTLSSVMVVQAQSLPDIRMQTMVEEPQAAAKLPPIIHLILDEHIGIEGIGPGLEQYADIKRDIRAFYERYGFRYYGKAYTWYGDTGNSIPSIMNFGERTNAIVETSGQNSQDPMGVFDLTLRKNRYFDTLIERGYVVRVYQSSWLNYCPENPARRRTCFSYLVTGPKVIENIGISVPDKAWIVSTMFVSNTRLWGLVLSLYYRVLETMFSSDELEKILETVEHHPDRSIVDSLATFSALERLLDDVAKSPRNSAYFVHLMFPHSPYAFSSDCSIRPAAAWVRPRNRFGKNTERSRQIRYGHYFEQVTCLYRKLGAFFDALKDLDIFDDAIIVVHSDHGSRISTRPPKVTASGDEGTARDLLDHHSAIFAVRRPLGTNAGYDLTPRPVEELLMEIMDITDGPSSAPCPDRPCVYVPSPDGFATRPIWGF